MLTRIRNLIAPPVFEDDDDKTRTAGVLNAILLAYSRVITHGEFFTPVDCSTVLDHALTNLKVAIDECGAIITHDELPSVMADEPQLTRLVQNLIGNGIKFHKKDTRPEVHIGVEHADNEWTFSVRDNGIGIDPKDFERIFDLSAAAQPGGV
jgi:light-regulated signal transduction histidine kinase (bacteriophytochrome)